MVEPPTDVLDDESARSELGEVFFRNGHNARDCLSRGSRVGGEFGRGGEGVVVCGLCCGLDRQARGDGWRAGWTLDVASPERLRVLRSKSRGIKGVVESTETRWKEAASKFMTEKKMRQT